MIFLSDLLPYNNIKLTMSMNLFEKFMTLVFVGGSAGFIGYSSFKGSSKSNKRDAFKVRQELLAR